MGGKYEFNENPVINFDWTLDSDLGFVKMSLSSCQKRIEYQTECVTNIKLFLKTIKQKT